MKRLKVRSIHVVFAASAVAMLASLASPGCSTESNANATCTPNVDSKGIHAVQNGCDTFAVCEDDAGTRQDPMMCCTPPPSGETVAECLYGYGVGAPIGSGGSGGTGGGTGGSGGGTGGGASTGGGGGTGGATDGGT